MSKRKAIKVWYAGHGRDYALMSDGRILSVNAIGLDIMDVRWQVLTEYGQFVGDYRDRECLLNAGYTNVESYQHVTRPIGE